MSTEQQWAKEFDTQLANLPGEGAILEAYGGGTARLNIELVEGKDPFIYGRAYVPSIVGQPISGWVLHEYDSSKRSVLPCLARAVGCGGAFLPRQRSARDGTVN